MNVNDMGGATRKPIDMTKLSDKDARKPTQPQQVKPEPRPEPAVQTQPKKEAAKSPKPKPEQAPIKKAKGPTETGDALERDFQKKLKQIIEAVKAKKDKEGKPIVKYTYRIARMYELGTQKRIDRARKILLELGLIEKRGRNYFVV